MPREIQDIHIGQLQFVTEAAPASGKYKRMSIPNLENRHCLGYLEGPAASLTHATRNERKYPTPLWKRVEDSEDFKEGMECAVIVGELDHPPERVDYSLSNGAVILTDWEIREDEGILWCRFAILDTPEGRKVMAYVNFGTVLGVSSRGLGDEVIINGETCIDPDTYEFYCFDVVAFPAVKGARQTYTQVEDAPATESYNARRDKFTEVLIEQVTKASNKEELETIKYVVESTNVPNKESLVESISHKLSSLSESTDDQSTAGEEKEDVLEKEILLGSLQAKESALNEKTRELEKATELLRRRGENASYLRRVVQEQQEEIETLNAAVMQGVEATTEVSQELDEANSSLSTVAEKLAQCENDLKESRRSAFIYKRDAERQLENSVRDIARYRKSLKEAKKETLCKSQAVESLNAQLEQKSKRVNMLESKLEEASERSKTMLRESVIASESDAMLIESLRNEISSLKQELESLKTEAASAKTKLQESVTRSNTERKETATVLNSYLRKCCEAYGIDYDVAKKHLPATFTTSEADKVVSELAERQDRFDMLPVSLEPVHGRVVEHRNSPTNTGSSFVEKALRRGQ